MFTVQQLNYREPTIVSFLVRAIIATTTTIALSILTEACAPRTSRSEIKTVIITGYVIYLALEIALWLSKTPSRPRRYLGQPDPTVILLTPTGADQSTNHRRQTHIGSPKTQSTQFYPFSSATNTAVTAPTKALAQAPTPTSVDQSAVQRRQKRRNYS